MRVYINSTGVDVPDGATALDAVRIWSSAEGEALAGGQRRLTDSRGLPAAPDSLAYGGAIFRVIPVRHAADVAESVDESASSR